MTETSTDSVRCCDSCTSNFGGKSGTKENSCETLFAILYIRLHFLSLLNHFHGISFFPQKKLNLKIQLKASVYPSIKK